MLTVGIALVVLPGPAFLVIPAGLAILAIEFAWAKRWLGKVRGLWHRHGVPGEANPGALRAPTAREKFKRSLNSGVAGAARATGIVVVTLAAVVLLVAPAVLGVLAMEWDRAKRWLGLGPG